MRSEKSKGCWRDGGDAHLGEKASQSSGITGMSHRTRLTSVLRNTQRRRHRRGEHHVMVDTETGVLQLQAEELLESPGAGRCKELIFSQSLWKERGPGDTLILDSGLQNYGTQEDFISQVSLQ
ncbi:hypothetical protein H8957_013150 [Semnopithecus entellus]